MISKKVAMKAAEKSRFGKLVAYLLDPQGKKTRVGEVSITNCISTDTTWAVREITATQRLNARAISDRTYHLLVSLRAGENPDAQTLRVIEERFCKELGYAEHQRISVVHHDTDNVHIHVAINKIHPERLTLHNPLYDYKTRSKLCAILEHELGLAQDNHQRGQTRGNDVMPKSGQESFQAWLQRHAQGFIDATSWEEFHGIADAHGVRLDLRANGFVFTNRRSLIHVKASSIDRRLAKTALEARLGTFVAADYEQASEKQEYQKRPRFTRVDTSRLWEEYQAQRELHKTLLLAVTVLGSIVATQILANSYRFHSALGFNLFHVYPPWSYFLWSHQWEQPSNHSLFAQAFGIGSLVTLGGFMLLLLDVARANSKVNPFLHGSARWADRRDIKAAGLLKNNGVYVGAWRDKSGKIHYLRHAGPEHVLCYAPTRSGKGVGLILPTLLSWQQSVFVTDLKGELYELTSGWRQKYAHNRILRFEPAAASGSGCFNPLDELRIGTEHEVGDVQNLALLIVDPDGKGLRSDNHWQKTAYSLLVGCILHLCYKGKVEGTPATFGALDHMLADSSRPIQDLWAEMLTYFHINGRNHPVVSASARDMMDRPSQEAGSVLSTTKTFLDLYRDPTVAKNTSRSDFGSGT